MVNPHLYYGEHERGVPRVRGLVVAQGGVAAQGPHRHHVVVVTSDVQRSAAAHRLRLVHI